MKYFFKIFLNLFRVMTLNFEETIPFDIDLDTKWRGKGEGKLKIDTIL